MERPGGQMAATVRKNRIRGNGKYYDAYRQFGDYYSQTSSAYKIYEKPETNGYPPGYGYKRERPKEAVPARRRRDAIETEKRRKAQPDADTRQQQQNKPRAKRKKLNLIRFRNRIDPSKANPMEAYVIIFIVALGLVGVIASRAMVQEATIRVARLRTELAETRTHSAALYTELYENFDKDLIERIAIEDMNMTYPKPHQEIRVNVPRASYIVQTKPNAPPETRAWLMDKLISLLNRNR